jgi:hypothetical protein
MALQRRRSLNIEKTPRQVNRHNGDDVPMDDLAARPIHDPVSQNSTGRNDVLHDLDNVQLDVDPEANKPSRTRAAAAVGRAKLADLTGWMLDHSGSN